MVENNRGGNSRYGKKKRGRTSAGPASFLFYMLVVSLLFSFTFKPCTCQADKTGTEQQHRGGFGNRSCWYGDTPDH